MRRLRSPPRRARGFAAATALFAIGLFVLLGAVATTVSRGNTKAKLFHETKDALVAQADLIRNTLLLCRTVFQPPDGSTDPHPGYPLTPPDGKVASIVCPGQAATPIWWGDARAMAPRNLPGFDAWTYVNDGASIRITTTAVQTGVPFYQDLINATVRKIGPQATSSGDTLTVTLVE